MTIDRIVRSVAGAFILVSLAFAHWVHPAWIWFTVFVGFNLFQSGLTNWCPLGRILKAAGVPEGPGACDL